MTASVVRCIVITPMPEPFSAAWFAAFVPEEGSTPAFWGYCDQQTHWQDEDTYYHDRVCRDRAEDLAGFCDPEHDRWFTSKAPPLCRNFSRGIFASRPRHLNGNYWSNNENG